MGSVIEDDDIVDVPALDAVVSMNRLSRGVLLLRIAAAAAVTVWVVDVIATVLALWDQYDFTSGGGPLSAGSSLSQAKLPRVLASTLSVTWQYLLVAVLAYAAAMFLETRRLPFLISRVDDDEEMLDSDEDESSG